MKREWRTFSRVIRVGLLLISSSRYSRTCLLNGFGTTLSANRINNRLLGTGGHKIISIMYTLNFPNGSSQTYPDQFSLKDAARAMGGDAEKVADKTYVFVPKK